MPSSFFTTLPLRKAAGIVFLCSAENLGTASAVLAEHDIIAGEEVITCDPS